MERGTRLNSPPIASYEYICPAHGPFTSHSRGDEHPCPSCRRLARRQWSFNLSAPFQPHYNPTVQSHVSSQSEFKSELSRTSEAMNERGIPSNFQPVDLMDKAALGVTNDGLDSTYDALVKQGRDGDARKLKAAMDK